MNNHFFFKKILYTFCILIASIFNNTMAYSQYVEFGEYQYRVDKPSIKIFVTYNYGNILSVVDTNSVQDKFTKRVVLINKKSYSFLQNYIKKHNVNKIDSINPELYRYIKVFNNKGEMTYFYKFSSNGYKSYLTDLFEYIEKSNCIDEADKPKLISKLRYWR